MSRVALSLAAAAAFVLAVQAAPAEAGKIGNTIAKTATKTAVKAAMKSGKDGEKDDEKAPSSRTSLDRQSVSGDVDARTAHARARLEEENASTRASSPVAATGQNSNADIVCLAGCN